MKYISNGFSPKMLNPKMEFNFTMEETTFDEIQENKNELISSIGHDTIAEHLKMEKNRMNIQLEIGDTLYLAYNVDCNQFAYRKMTFSTIWWRKIIMIYVTDNLSMLMFENQTYNISTRTIKKSKLIRDTKDAVSSIGSWKIAKLLNKRVGKKEIRLQPGDVIYVITSKFGRNKTDYKKENTFRFQMFSIQ